MIVASLGFSRHGRRHEPDSEVGPDERIRLDELIRELEDSQDTAERGAR